MNHQSDGGVIVNLKLVDWLSRVRGNLDALEAMDQNDPGRVPLIRETEALFDAAERAGLRKYVDQFRYRRGINQRKGN